MRQVVIPRHGPPEVLEVRHYVNTAEPGSTYISQPRLTDMTTPDAAHVRTDDPTNRTDVGPACYTTEAGLSVDGTLSLGLKVVFGIAEDEIRVGMVRIDRAPMKGRGRKTDGD